MSSERASRTQAKARFTRAKNKLDSAIDNGLLTTTVQNRYDALKVEWDNVQSKHDEYMTTVEQPSPDDEEWIELISQEYDESEEKADRFLFDRLHEEKAILDRQQEEEREKEEEKKREIELSLKLKRLQISREQEIGKFDIAADSMKSLIDQSSSDKHDLTALVSTMVEARKRLDKQFTTCEEIQNELALAVSDEERARERDYMTSITKIYYNLSDKSQMIISKFKKTSHSSPVTSTSVAGLRMEKLKFPPFEGDCRKYPRFKEQFIRHIKPLYHVDQEAFALRSYLNDTVREDIEAFGEDVEAAWARLDAKYGDEGKMIDLVMSDIKRMAPASDQHPKTVLEMIATIENAYRDLKCLGLENEMRNATIVSLIEERLPDKVKDKWLDVITDSRMDTSSKRDKFPALLELLTKYRERLEYDMRELRSTEHERGGAHVTDERKPKNDSTRTYPWCWLHPDQNDHPIWRCEEFKQTPAAERIELMRNHNACFGCLQQGHVQHRCRRNFKCRVDNCGLRHHQLIHDAHVEGIVFHNNSSKHEGKTSLQIQELQAKIAKGDNVKLNVMWDDGSTLSLITFEKAKVMGLKGSDVNLDIDTVGGQTKKLRSKRFKLPLIDKKGELVEISALGIDKISTHIPQINVEEALKEFKMPTSSNVSRPKGEIDCLIGFEYAGYHPVKINAKRHLLLMENRFGLIIAGHQTKETCMNQTIVAHEVVQHAVGNISEFLTMEELGIQCQPQCGGCKCGKCHLGGKNMTIREEKELELIEKNLSYDHENKQWQASYPWIQDPNHLPNNKIAAMGSLKSLEKRLKRDENRAATYQRQIEDMIERGVCRKLGLQEMNEYTGPVFYLPHHDVIKKESESTPCRIVFNSSASFHGHSLNKYLAKGPDLINSLLGVMMRFREERVAFIGDIRKMFHSITIPLKDQMTHRFLWRDFNESRLPDTYVITRVNFGDKPSGTIAIAALRKTADMYEAEYPEASRTIKDNSYVDDILDSVKDVKQAKSVTNDIDTVLANGNFFVKEWHISHDEQKENDEHIRKVRPHRDEKHERVLGMVWNQHEDILSFKTTPIYTQIENVTADPFVIREIVSEPLTKRLILSKVNGIYDPLGLAAPFTVRSKIMLRKLWTLQKGLEWDEPISEELSKEWRVFFEETKELNDVEFFRCTKPDAAIGNPSLIIFSDASQDAYGAVAYARWKVEPGKFESRIMLSKNRIAPMKTINIVRLELAGAVISKRLRVTIEEETRYSFDEILHIVDSEVVKAMIGKESYGFNTYTANRLGEIQSGTNESEWYWISREHNISDWITHGKRPSEISRTSEWQLGPKFLSKPISECQYPIERT